jgi:hypothetical protein
LLERDAAVDEPRPVEPGLRERATRLIAEIRRPDVSDEQCGQMLSELERILGCPHVLDLMFWHRPGLRDEEVIDRALMYRPFAL